MAPRAVIIQEGCEQTERMMYWDSSLKLRDPRPRSQIDGSPKESSGK